MKADITATGTVVLTPETGAEAFALMCWSERAVVGQQDLARAESFHYRGSSLTLNMGSYPETLPREGDSPSEQRAKDLRYRKESQWRMDP